MIDPRIMALMSMSAGLMDPRGTYGSAGASMNNALQAGMSTYLPLMQWQAMQQERKEDKDYRKDRDRVMDRFRKDQQSVTALQLDMQSRGLDIQEMTARNSAANADLNRQLLQFQIDAEKTRQEMIKQFMPTTVAETKQQVVDPGPRVGMVPPSQYGPRVKQPQDPMLQVPQGRFNPMPQAESLADIMRPTVAPQQPVSQFSNMTPSQQMLLGSYLKHPGLEQAGKDAMEMEQFKKKEDYKVSLKKLEEKYDLRGDPIMGYDVFTRDTKEWVGKYDSATGKLIPFGKVVK